MKNYVLTAGTKYVDIDVLACTIALSEILAFDNIKSSIFLPGPFNGTIPKQYYHYKESFIDILNDDDRYILLDISDPNHIDSKISLDAVDFVYDHHYGYEKFWKDRLCHKAIIGPVGACATLIAEQAIDSLNQLSKDSIHLLLLAIISNTLCFKAKVTSDRDKKIFDLLLPLSHFSENWIESYYNEIENGFLEDIENNIKNDMKTINNFHFSQIELYKIDSFLKKHSLSSINNLMNNLFDHWVLNLVHIDKNENILLFSSVSLANLFQEKMSFIKKENGFFKTNRLCLRKEFLKYL
jgi:nanoRNase/pAp phosphatase (c-di-AMP/oligoRNAs hydrolase)